DWVKEVNGTGNYLVCFPRGCPDLRKVGCGAVHGESLLDRECGGSTYRRLCSVESRRTCSNAAPAERATVDIDRSAAGRGACPVTYLKKAVVHLRAAGVGIPSG